MIAVKIREVLREEFHRLIQGKYPVLLIIFILPLMFTVLFGMVYHENVVKNIPLVIYDQDQSNLSRSLIQTYTDSERFRVTAYVNTQEELDSQLAKGEALVGLGIPRDFSKDVKRGNTANILLIVDSANNMFGNAALSAAQEINRTFSVAVGQKLIEGIGVLPDASMAMVYPVRFGIRILYNPTNGYTPFMLSGLMLNGLQIGLMLVLGPLITEEFKRKRYGRSYASWVIIFGKVFPCWLASLVAYALSLVLMVLVFDVPCQGSVADMFIIGGAFSFSVLGALSMLAVFSPNVVMSLQVPLVYIMPGLLFSGLSWPSFAMNDTAWILSHILPMTYGADALRDILLAGHAPTLWQDAGGMFVLGSVFYVIAVLVMHIRRTYDLKVMLIGWLNSHRKKKGVC